MEIKKLPKGVYMRNSNTSQRGIEWHHSLETRNKMSVSAKHYLASHPRKHPSKSTLERISIGVKEAFKRPDVKHKRHLAQLGNKNSLGYKHTLRSKRKMSKSRIGKHHKPNCKHCEIMKLDNVGKDYWLGKNHTQETKDKMALSRSKHIIPCKDTSIEIIVQDYLTNRGLVKGKDFTTHKSFCINWPHYHQVDICLNNVDIVIECDGIYWHSLPGCKERDFEIDNELFNQYIDVIRLPESDIRSRSFEMSLNSIFDNSNVQTLRLENNQPMGL